MNIDDNFVNEFCNLQVHVTYQDTDIAGVVYYGNYFNYAEKGRAKIIHALFGKTVLEDQHWAVHSTNCCYLSPAKIDDIINVETRVCEIGAASLVFNHIFTVNKDIISNMSAKLVSIDKSLKLSRINKEVLNKIQKIYLIQKD